MKEARRADWAEECARVREERREVMDSGSGGELELELGTSLLERLAGGGERRSEGLGLGLREADWDWDWEWDWVWERDRDRERDRERERWN